MPDEEKPPPTPEALAALKRALKPAPLVKPDGSVDADAVLGYLVRCRQDAGTALVCPLSGHNEWSVTPRLIHPLMRLINNDPLDPSPGKGGKVTGSWPLIQITCNRCAYTFFLDYGLIEFINEAESGSGRG